MHYYQHHIGDFIKDTANLSNEQIAVYLKMIWRYYLDEKPFTDSCEDIAFAVRSDEKTVQLLLRHFFVNQDDGWHQIRCDREISHFHGKAEKARDSANARWNNANALRTHSKRNASATENYANQEPITNNHKPDIQKVSPPEGVSISVWADFVKYRKALKAPITDTAIAGFKREAAKAGITLEQALVITIENNWRGFKADWLTAKQQTTFNVFAGAI